MVCCQSGLRYVEEKPSIYSPLFPAPSQHSAANCPKDCPAQQQILIILLLLGAKESTWDQLPSAAVCININIQVTCSKPTFTGFLVI